VIGFVLRRVAASLLLLYLVVTLTFFLIHITPGDPSDLLEGPRATLEQRMRLRRLYRLDRPLPEQYLAWLDRVALYGDWGTSFAQNRPVTTAIAEALPPTARLAGAALAVEYAAGLVLGIAAARRPGGLADHLIRVGSLLFFSVPPFWLGLMLLLLFAALRQTAGAGTVALLDGLRSLVLPALVLGAYSAGSTIRFVRGSLLEVMGRESIRAARARGLSNARVVWVHGLRNALAPLIQLFAISLPALLSGSLVTEVVFSRPGLGRLAFDAIGSRDYPMILATTALSAALVTLGNLSADLAHAAIDPRVRDA